MSERKVGSVIWIDLVNPAREELEQLGNRFQLPSNVMQGSLEPDHLPKFDEGIGASILILRAYDLESKSNADTIQGLTRKVVIFFGKDFIITVHRVPLTCVQSVFDTASDPAKVVPDLIMKAARTFDAAVQAAHQNFETFENQIGRLKVQKVYKLKRRVTLLKRILRMTLDSVHEMSVETGPVPASGFLEKNLFQLEEIYDNLMGLLSLEISISSQKANEVMRILTVYSIVFLPLNLVAGIYGMNFEHMPELHWLGGYPMAIGIMATIAAGVLLWFKKRGWLGEGK